MQYPVPQFTDVEDKIIGSLSIRQFGTIFAAGIVIFLGYSGTKSLVVVGVLFFLIGLPALVIAFGKVNGRPLYKSFPYVIKFILAPKILVFHKEASRISQDTKFKNVEITPPPPPPLTKAASHNRMLEVNQILEKNAREEQELLKKI